MKKIIITFLVLILVFNINYSHAWSCLIKDSMAPSLSEYIKNTKKALSILSKNKVTTSSKFKDKANEVIWSISSSYNSVFDFDNYFAKIYFEVELQKSIEVPRQLKRDLRRLKYLWESIWKDMEDFLKNEKNTNIENFCDNFTDIKCNVEDNISKKELYFYILKNYKLVESNFIYTVIWDNSKLKELDLVSPDFKLELEKYYNKESWSACNNEEWEYWEIISEKTDNIWKTNKQAKDWIKKWEEAWALIIWKDSKKTKKREIEKKELKKELSRQWVSGDNQTNMLEALDKYNSEEWFSENNNFASNSFNNIKIKVNNKLKVFSEKIWDFLEVEEIDDIAIKDLSKAKQNSTNSYDIKKRIDKIYKSQLIFAWISENKTDNLRTRLINMHLEIVQSINILQQSCKKSVKICNQQSTWKWNCGKCQ